MIELSDPNYQKLLDLFEQRAHLFDDITDRYPKLKRNRETLTRDGESEVIQIGKKIYRFNWEDVEDFGIQEFDEEEDYED